MNKHISKEVKKEVKFLAGIGYTTDQITGLLDGKVSKSTISRIRTTNMILTADDISELKTKYSAQDKVYKDRVNKTTEIPVSVDDNKEVVKKEVIKGIKKEILVEENKLIVDKEKIESKLDKLFGVALEDLMYVSEYEQEEKRDLIVIAEEFEKLFGIIIDKPMIYSFQEKYEALKRRDMNAVKIIIDKINYVYRRTISETHRWKFEGNEDTSVKDKIMGHIINNIKWELDGTAYRSISEAQHKTVEIICNLLGVKEDEISLEAERKIMNMMTDNNVFDLINQCIEVSKTHDTTLEFINKVDLKLRTK